MPFQTASSLSHLISHPTPTTASWDNLPNMPLAPTRSLGLWWRVGNLRPQTSLQGPCRVKCFQTCPGLSLSPRLLRSLLRSHLQTLLGSSFPPDSLAPCCERGSPALRCPAAFRPEVPGPLTSPEKSGSAQPRFPSTSASDRCPGHIFIHTSA